MHTSIKKLLIGGVVLAVIAAVAILASWNILNRPLTIDEDQTALVVERGSGLFVVAEKLAEQGLMNWPRVLSGYGRITGKTQIKAGEYKLDFGDTPLSLLDKLIAGKVVLHSIAIIEGWTVKDLLAAIAEHPALEQTLVEPTAQTLAAELGLETPHAEGWFFPDTYKFPQGTTDLQLLRQAHELMQRKLDAAWESRQPDNILEDRYEALILASIIERESAMQSERAEIAGVFARRLKIDMRLQTDPTVIYGLGDEFDGNLTRRHLRTDTPYNTYTRKGLPPTPIALPGAGSLAAAVAPADGDALFFVATGKGDGSHQFSATLEEHNAAVASYLAVLRSRRK